MKASDQTSDQTRRAATKGGRPKIARGASTRSPAAGPAWSVRGVPANVREIANREATARGATVGDWVAEAIVRHARGPSDQTGVRSDDANLPAVANDPVMEQIADVGRRLQALHEAIERDRKPEPRWRSRRSRARLR